MDNYRTTCRMCDGNLKMYLDLGHHAPSDAFLTKDQLNEPETTYPLRLCACESCGLSQLDYIVPPEILYQQDYPYESSTTETGKKHYFDFAAKIVERFKLTKDDFVVDIGSNVGVLLDGFIKNGVYQHLGIDPAPNIVKKANENGIHTECDFFNSKTYDKYIGVKASIVTATNVFAHVDDLNDFMLGIKKLLKDDGVFIFESPSMFDLVQNMGWDSLYHEHLSYLSLTPVVKFIQKHGMEVFDVEPVDIHQGSFRVFIGFNGAHSVSENVTNYLQKEKDFGLHEVSTMIDFADKVKLRAAEIFDLVYNLYKNGERVVALSMPAKGQTLINYCGIGRYLAFGTEKSNLKIGKYSPGSHLYVLPDSKILDYDVDAVLLLAWNFKKEILNNNKDFKGKFIIPMPNLEII